MATFGDPGWGKAEGRGQKAEGNKEGKFPKILWYKGFKTSAFSLLPSALKPFSVLITKIGQEPIMLPETIGSISVPNGNIILTLTAWISSKRVHPVPLLPEPLLRVGASNST